MRAEQRGKNPVAWITVGLLLTAGLTGQGCKAAGPDVIIAAAMATTLAVSAAVVNKELGGCYAICDEGWACNPRTGLCEKIPCGGCPIDMQCDQDQKPPQCVPIYDPGMGILGRAPQPGQTAGAARPEPSAGRQADPAGCTRVVLAHPVWPTPASYQPAEPLFFLRINRPIDPEQILARVELSQDQSALSAGRFVLLDSFLVICPSGTCTDLFFRPREALPAGQLMTWRLPGAAQASLGPACPGADQDGAYLLAKFITADEDHPATTTADFWSPDQLIQTYGQEQAEAMFAAQEQVLTILKGYQQRPRGD